ncbi:MAG: TlpA family protein disulfide reductase [Bacteroidales bacterium]|nr:TlpA family protein disulfide reductase [Bacteroidales bacterium]
MRKVIAFFSILFAAFIAHAQKATIIGCNEEYANQTISVYQYSDYFTKNEELIGTFTTDGTGYFSFTFDCTTTREIYMYLGIYKAFLFVSPGSEYELAMPPYQEKTLAEELNPYYEPTDISLGVINSLSERDINILILSFNSVFETFLSEHGQEAFLYRDKNLVEKFESRIDSIFSRYDDDDFFRIYKNYRLYSLRYMVYQRDNMSVTRKHYLNQPFFYYNPSYMNLFKMMWKDYIINNHTRDMGKNLKIDIIYGKSPNMFKKTLGKNIAFRNDTLKELFLLQCLDDCLKDPDVFPPAPVYQTLDSVIIISTIPEHKSIAENIKKKYTALEFHDNAPYFELYNQDSVLYTLDKFKGKYVYLNFCRSENYACIKDYKVLKKMNEKTKRDLSIVTLSYEKTFEDFRSFRKANPQYNWTFLYAGDNPEIGRQYKLRGMPTYMLLDKTGKIEMISAPTPADNFQETFSKMMIKKRKEEAAKKKRQGQGSKGRTW